MIKKINETNKIKKYVVIQDCIMNSEGVVMVFRKNEEIKVDDEKIFNILQAQGLLKEGE